MPSAEGRNDVFSGLFCYWTQAPSLVIYDFACQLAAYAYVREFDFFKNTRYETAFFHLLSSTCLHRFLIDEFHSFGHTACSAGGYLAGSMKADPSLRSVNSSAAEVGNGGLKKIRKALGFMREDHAILFFRVYMNIWNRHHLIAMGS